MYNEVTPETYKRTLSKVFVDNVENVRDVGVDFEGKLLIVTFFLKEITTQREIGYLERETKSLLKMFSDPKSRALIFNYEIVGEHG